MEQKYLIFLLGFEVTLQDRRNGEEKEDFIVIATPEEHPDDLANAHDIINRFYGRLGFDVKNIDYQECRVKEMELKEEYDKALSAVKYEEQKGE